MRYDKLVNELQRAAAQYENTVRRLIARAAQDDANISTAMLSHLKRGKAHANGNGNGNGHTAIQPHHRWVHTRAGKKKLAKIMKARWARAKKAGSTRLTPEKGSD
jgi:hypothetical protein